MPSSSSKKKTSGYVQQQNSSSFYRHRVLIKTVPQITEFKKKNSKLLTWVMEPRKNSSTLLPSLLPSWKKKKKLWFDAQGAHFILVPSPDHIWVKKQNQQIFVHFHFWCPSLSCNVLLMSCQSFVISASTSDGEKCPHVRFRRVQSPLWSLSSTL